MDALAHCVACPRQCGVDRLSGETGWCRAAALPKAARAALHHWEEPCISGAAGSGTVFFSHCNLACVFCQNHDISWGGFGREVSIEELADIFLDLGARAANINLVSPTHYSVQIGLALEIARSRGLGVPVVYNTNGYENVETIRLLDGLVDIYLPDLKYCSDSAAVRYSNAPGYFDVATRAITEMKRQVGDIVIGADGLARRGLLIRHLVLPGLSQDSYEVLIWMRTHLGRDTWVSLMSQYFPTHRAWQFPEISEPVDPREYSWVADRLDELGLHNGYCQSGERAVRERDYVPAFDLAGLGAK
ncbi:MAG: radical SAM protein [Clostridia bacterium]|nr:radical SAM protein [Clostridia bacterium]